MESRLGTLRAGAATVAAVAAALVLAACGSSASPASDGSTAGQPSGTSGAAGTRVRIVASTDVWGDIARDIAGDDAEITSIITNPDADPHSYEANAQNQLALSKADLVIENGGGYDDFVGTMLKATNNPKAAVINAVDLSGFAATQGDELNEHVWYDFPTVAKVADAIAAALVKIDPPNAGSFQTNATHFAAQLTTLEGVEKSIKDTHAGTPVAITEPVPLYMLQAAGLVNKTPPAFSEAIEEGDDVAPAVLKQTLDLFTSGEVKLLAYNEQTSSPETEQILDAAREHHVSIVPVTETLPSGTNYLGWMQSNLTAIKKALG